MSLKYPSPSEAAVELLRAPTRVLLADPAPDPVPVPAPAAAPPNPLEEEPLELEPEEVVLEVLPVLPPDNRWCCCGDP